MPVAVKKTTPVRYLLIAGAMAAALMMGACSMETDTALSSKRVRLEHGPAYESMPVSAMNDAAIAALAGEYRRKGQGTLELTVTYDPRSAGNTAMDATEHAARIARQLRYNGVRDIETAILPVNMLGDQAQLLVQYHAITARAPDCEPMGGFEGRETAPDENYEYGCTTQTILARQIARPKDLAGRAGTDGSDGRRQTALTEGYMGGSPSPALQGYSSSE